MMIIVIGTKCVIKAMLLSHVGATRFRIMENNLITADILYVFLCFL